MGRTLRIEIPRVFRPLMKPARYKGAFGGRGSAKSHTFAEMVLQRCMQQPTNVVCVREYQRTLEQSVKRLMEHKIRDHSLGGYFRVRDTRIENPGGGMTIFEGMATHNADSIKSLEGYDIAWVEEAQMLSQRSLDLLRPTIRKPGSELWFTWNPRNESDAVDKFLRDDPPKGSTVVEAQWKDNPWFPEVLRHEMEWDRAHDPEKYAHVWLGRYEQLTEARVFRNWRVEDFDTPKNAVFYFGGDWGFAQDPTVLVRCWLDGHTLYVDDEAYRVGCEIDDTPDLFDSIGDGMAREWTITADSARPETISYLKRHGYPRIRGANKGPGSVEEGVKFLQSYDIVVHPRCKHTIDELTLYRYKTDPRTGQVLPRLEDKKNHVIDSLRYATEHARKAKPRGAIEIGYMSKRTQASREDHEGDPDRDHEGAVIDPACDIGSRRSNPRKRLVPSGW